MSERVRDWAEASDKIAQFIGPAVGLRTSAARDALARLSEDISDKQALISDYERQLSDLEAQLAAATARIEAMTSNAEAHAAMQGQARTWRVAGSRAFAGSRGVGAGSLFSSGQHRTHDDVRGGAGMSERERMAQVLHDAHSLYRLPHLETWDKQPSEQTKDLYRHMADAVLAQRAEPEHMCAAAGCLLCRGQVTHESAPAVSPEGDPGSGTRPLSEPGETDSQGFHTGYQAGVAATTEPVGLLADTIIALRARIEAMTTNAEAIEARAAEHEQTRADLATAQEAREMAQARVKEMEALVTNAAVRRYEALAKMEYRAEQAEAQIEKLRAALSNLLQQARPVSMGWRKVRLEVTMEPEVYDALRALLAEPGA